MAVAVATAAVDQAGAEAVVALILYGFGLYHFRWAVLGFSDGVSRKEELLV